MIIYDLMTNTFEEVDYVIKTLKTSKLEKKKTLIIISSVMTWVNTLPKFEKGEAEAGGDPEEGAEESDLDPDDPAAEELEEKDDLDSEKEEEDGGGDPEEEKEAPPKVVFFKESDNHLRVPHERFIPHKNLETLALSAPKTQPNLKVHIMCCGVRYGLGEGAFYNHFKNAWVQAPEALQIVGDGTNLIPTLHVKDLAKSAKRIIDADSEKSYLFCVDKTKRPSQKRIIRSISKGVGTGKTTEISDKELPDSIFWKDFMLINLKMRSSSLFKKLPPPNDPETGEAMEVDEDYGKFDWHCRGGIVASARDLNNEFNAARDLQPVKIMVTGPPAVGKSYYSEKIHKNYDLPHVSVKQIADKARVLSKSEEEDGIGAEIKAAIDEATTQELEKVNAARDE